MIIKFACWLLRRKGHTVLVLTDSTIVSSPKEKTVSVSTDFVGGGGRGL